MCLRGVVWSIHRYCISSFAFWVYHTSLYFPESIYLPLFGLFVCLTERCMSRIDGCPKKKVELAGLVYLPPLLGSGSKLPASAIIFIALFWSAARTEMPEKAYNSRARDKVNARISQTAQHPRMHKMLQSLLLLLLLLLLFHNCACACALCSNNNNNTNSVTN